jgi:alpha-beta hydrolase superfamily lysophospholipase
LTWLRRHLRAVGAVAALLVVGLGVAVAATWHFSSLVLIPDHSPWSEKIDVEAVSPGRVELGRDEATSRPGYYGLAWQGGHAIVGQILSETPDTVRRRLSDVRGYLEPGLDAGFDSSVYAGNPRQSRGLRFRSVGVPSELGPMPAWLIPGSSRIWAIVVHGINDDRQVGLRVAPTLHRAGLPSLLISYRDDLGAPSSPDGHHHQGETEWRDLQAAAHYALEHGAHRLVLDGYSMGGALITQFMERSPLADRVAGLVLDAPALDWKAILEFNAERMGLPGFLALPVEWAIDVRTEPDWDSLDALQHPNDFHLPILLFHGTEDRVVPISTSDDFARELGSRVTYYRVPAAGHTQSWNVAPRLYDRRLRRFLLQISHKTSRARPHRSGSKKEEPAATYSPRGLPPKYHRR